MSNPAKIKGELRGFEMATPDKADAPVIFQIVFTATVDDANVFLERFKEINAGAKVTDTAPVMELSVDTAAPKLILPGGK